MSDETARDKNGKERLCEILKRKGIYCGISIDIDMDIE